MVAETEGFEPSRPFWGSAHLANECLQPLGHVSNAPSYAGPSGPMQAAGSRARLEMQLLLDDR